MSLIEKAESIAKEFEFTPEQVNNGVKEFIRLMDEGLQEDGKPMAMIPTYVTGVPNGTEKGVYLAVDLGGTNFRVCSVVLNGDTTFTLTQSKVAIPRSLMVSDSHSLFSFLAKQVAEFVETHHSDHFSEDPEHHLRLGFTFSFPVDQKAVNKGYLIRWTKGFDIPDAIGKDVCALLQAEIDALNLPVRVAALVNDTVGTLMARSYTSPGKTGTLLGAIFGTGTNGAYVEKLSRITKMAKPGVEAGEYDTSTGEMIVNTEWGSFDNALRVLPDTPYDRALDSNSVNPGMQMFEKRVSGMFLGELLRNAVLTMKSDAGLFSTATIDENSPLYTPWSIDTSVLSYIEADETPGLNTTREVLEKEMGVMASGVSHEDAQAVKILVHAIGKRSARLSAIPIAAIVLATGKISPAAETNGFAAAEHKALDTVKETVEAVEAAITGEALGAPSANGVSHHEEEVIDIGVDGSVVEFYPNFENYVRVALREVPEVGVKGEKRIRIGIAKDGSGVGAALIALVAGSQKSRNMNPTTAMQDVQEGFMSYFGGLWQWLGLGLGWGAKAK
ncbi:glucokinase [Rhizina undulata]